MPAPAADRCLSAPFSEHEVVSGAPAGGAWSFPMAGDTRFSWDYTGGDGQLLSLYAKGKERQWDAAETIDWTLEVDPYDPLGLPTHANALRETRVWSMMGQRDRELVRQHLASWQFSQFLHGEQGAMLCSARIVESVPDLDAKLFAATQTIDEARHVEAYSRFLHDKVQLVYPINPDLGSLLADTLSDSRWDLPYLGMQVLIEGMGMAAFGMLRDLTTVELPRQILAQVMADEARHVAFGRIALREYYAELSDAERNEREEFVVDGLYLIRDRLCGDEVWETLDMPVAQCHEAVTRSTYLQTFHDLLLRRILPCVRDIGLWGERLRSTCVDLGIEEPPEVPTSSSREVSTAEKTAQSASRDESLAVVADVAHRSPLTGV